MLGIDLMCSVSEWPDGVVGQVAASRPQVALPWRLPIGQWPAWAPMNGLVGQLAARQPQVALLARLSFIGHR